MTMTIPDALPYLSRGNHTPGSMRACIMDAISILSGRPWDLDKPKVVLPLLRPLFIRVNDDASDAQRQELWMPGIRAMGTATPGDPNLETINHRASVLLVAMQAFRMLAADQAGDHAEGVQALGLVTRWSETPSRDLRMAAVGLANTPLDGHTCVGCRLAVAAARGIVSYSASATALANEQQRRSGHTGKLEFLTEVLDDLEALQKYAPSAVSDQHWDELRSLVPATPPPAEFVAPQKFASMMTPIPEACVTINAGDTMTWTWSVTADSFASGDALSQSVPFASGVLVVE